MKTDTHPKFYNAVVTCSCGNQFNTGSTKPTMRVEV
ncbi:MAG: 50S ribosomal protein L31, partial [Chloroflexi bacterium]|nr:50S ribosomal protein L31 [Chloroflexota bacterium]